MVPGVGRPGDRYLYRMTTIDLYSQDMDVGITELRANLAEWVRRAADGEFHHAVALRHPRVRDLPGETLADTVIRLREERGC